MAGPRSTHPSIPAGLALVGALIALVLTIGATASAAAAKTIWLCQPGTSPTRARPACRRPRTRRRWHRCG